MADTILDCDPQVYWGYRFLTVLLRALPSSESRIRTFAVNSFYLEIGIHKDFSDAFHNGIGPCLTNVLKDLREPRLQEAFHGPLESDPSVSTDGLGKFVSSAPLMRIQIFLSLDQDLGFLFLI